jgi:hypothetical protein
MTNYKYYTVMVHYDLQTTRIEYAEKKLAEETADRLNYFFATNGLKIEVSLHETNCQVEFDIDDNEILKEDIIEISY